MNRFKYFIALMVLFFSNIILINASSGMLVQDSVQDCSDGNKYGYHTKDGVKHYHTATLSEKGNYVAGEKDSLGTKNPCTDEVEVETENVVFYKCVDGDTATVKINGKITKLRFLAIDTPETKHPEKGEEPYGKQASNYTCNRLQEGKIRIEYDPGSDKTDKYNRQLVWVYVDDSLLQEELVEEGLAEVAYLYGDYMYTDILEEKQDEAKKNKKNIWSGEKDTDFNDYITYALIAIVIIFTVIKYITSHKK